MTVEKVFALDRRIRYCTVLNHAGKTVAGGMRPGVKSLEPVEEYDRVGFQMSTIQGIHDTTEQYFGKADYTIIHRKKVMMLILQMDPDQIVNVTLEPNYPLSRVEGLIKRIRRRLPEHSL